VAESGGAGRGGRDQEALLLVAGLADAALGGAQAVLRRAREVTRRSDLAELARDGQEEMKARGRIALRRLGPGPEAHLELLARRVVAARAAQGDEPAGTDG
jgi:hypothetical protein